VDFRRLKASSQLFGRCVTSLQNGRGAIQLPVLFFFMLHHFDKLSIFDRVSWSVVKFCTFKHLAGKSILELSL
jgi:hypothetical protein